MKRLRIWYAVLLAWFCVLFNIERVFPAVNLASPIYVLAPVLALAMVVAPGLNRASPLWVAGLAALVVLPVKIAFGYPCGGAWLPLTVLEVAAVALTALLAGRITAGLDEFRGAVFTTMTSHLYDRSRSFTEGQSAMCREVRRARIHGRPLAVLALRPSANLRGGKLSEFARARFTREVEQDMLEKYVVARLGEMISTEVHDSDVIVHRNDHFVVLLPEADRERAHEAARRLKSAARRVLGLQLDIGSSAFPEEEITFVRLLERAEGDMRAAASGIRPSGVENAANGEKQATEDRAAPQADLRVVLEADGCHAATT